MTPRDRASITVIHTDTPTLGVDTQTSENDEDEAAAHRSSEHDTRSSIPMPRQGLAMDLNEPYLFPACFPELFPTGHGIHTDVAAVPLSTVEWARHLLLMMATDNPDERPFARHIEFICVCAKLMMKKEALTLAHIASTRHSSGDVLSETHLTALAAMLRRTTGSENTAERTAAIAEVERMALNRLVPYANAAPGTNLQMMQARGNLETTFTNPMGPPTWFITFNGKLQYWPYLYRRLGALDPTQDVFAYTPSPDITNSAWRLQTMRDNPVDVILEYEYVFTSWMQCIVEGRAKPIGTLTHR